MDPWCLVERTATERLSRNGTKAMTSACTTERPSCICAVIQRLEVSMYAVPCRLCELEDVGFSSCLLQTFVVTALLQDRNVCLIVMCCTSLVCGFLPCFQLVQRISICVRRTLFAIELASLQRNRRFPCLKSVWRRQRVHWVTGRRCAR